MQKELIDKANEIIGLIEKDERAVEELEKYAESGKTLYATKHSAIILSENLSVGIYFEDWEIRLMIHNKKQKINALRVQLERL